MEDSAAANQALERLGDGNGQKPVELVTLRSATFGLYRGLARDLAEHSSAQQRLASAKLRLQRLRTQTAQRQREIHFLRIKTGLDAKQAEGDANEDGPDEARAEDGRDEEEQEPSVTGAVLNDFHVEAEGETAEARIEAEFEARRRLAVRNARTNHRVATLKARVAEVAEFYARGRETQWMLEIMAWTRKINDGYRAMRQAVSEPESSKDAERTERADRGKRRAEPRRRAKRRDPRDERRDRDDRDRRDDRRDDRKDDRRDERRDDRRDERRDDRRDERRDDRRDERRDDRRDERRDDRRDDRRSERRDDRRAWKRSRH